MSRGPIPDKSPTRPTAPEVQRLIDAFFQFPNCGVGGPLHAVIDDGNWEDVHLQARIDNHDAEDYAQCWTAEVMRAAQIFARVLLLLTGTQRRQLESCYDRPRAVLTIPEFVDACEELLKRAET